MTRGFYPPESDDVDIGSIVAFERGGIPYIVIGRNKDRSSAKTLIIMALNGSEKKYFTQKNKLFNLKKEILTPKEEVYVPLKFKITQNTIKKESIFEEFWLNKPEKKSQKLEISKEGIFETIIL